MLLILMYHRIGEGKLANSKKTFSEHLKFIKDHYPVVLPGEKLNEKISVCLTFDDAFCDFYKEVFPLLRQMNLKAVLGVPTRYILEKTSIHYSKRISLPYYETLKNNHFQTHAPYCTWQEIEEMVKSSFVKVASHSHTHANLVSSSFDYALEIKHSKKIIETRLNQKIDTFIYPFGKVNSKIHSLILQDYQFGMRIGNGFNCGWKNEKQPLLRINGDHLKNASQPFTLFRLSQYLFKYLASRLT